MADQPPPETARMSTCASEMSEGTNTTVAPLAKVIIVVMSSSTSSWPSIVHAR